MLVVPGKLHHNVLQAAHENLGHMGINKTYAFLQQWYFWPGIKNKSPITSEHAKDVHRRI